MDVVTLSAAKAQARRNHPPKSINSIALMGDSITAQNNPITGNTSNSLTYTWDAVGWWAWCQIALGQRFEYLANTAVGGTTTTQELTQIDAVLASGAAWVCWLGGVNDLSASSTPNPATTIAALTAGYDRILAAGRKLIVATFYRSTTQTTTARKSAQAVINQFIRRYAATHADVVLWDVAAIMTDPDTGCVWTTYTRTEGDGNHVHPNNAGAQLMGRHLAQLLAPLTSPLSPLITSSDDPYNLVTNGLFLADPPNSWASSDGSGGAAPGTVSRVARTDGGPGYLWQAALVATGADTGKINLFYSNTSVISATHGGHVIIPRCYFETGVQNGPMDWSNIDHFRLWVVTIGAAANVASYGTFQGTDTGAVSSSHFPRSGVFEGPPVTIPASGVTRITVFVEIATTAAAAGGGTIRIGQVEVHDLTACGY